MGDATRGEEAIALALKTPRNSDERIWLGDYGSPLRDSALMLSLLEENKLLPDEQYSLLNTLSQQAFGERWLSTQEVTRCSGCPYSSGFTGQMAGANHFLC